MTAHDTRRRITREQRTIDVALPDVARIHLSLFSSLRGPVSSAHVAQEVLKH